MRMHMHAGSNAAHQLALVASALSSVRRHAHHCSEQVARATACQAANPTITTADGGENHSAADAGQALDSSNVDLGRAGETLDTLREELSQADLVLAEARDMLGATAAAAQAGGGGAAGGGGRGAGMRPASAGAAAPAGVVARLAPFEQFVYRLTGSVIGPEVGGVWYFTSVKAPARVLPTSLFWGTNDVKRLSSVEGCAGGSGAPRGGGEIKKGNAGWRR